MAFIVIDRNYESEGWICWLKHASKHPNRYHVPSEITKSSNKNLICLKNLAFACWYVLNLYFLDSNAIHYHGNKWILTHILTEILRNYLNYRLAKLRQKLDFKSTSTTIHYRSLNPSKIFNFPLDHFQLHPESIKILRVKQINVMFGNFVRIQC